MKVSENMCFMIILKVTKKQHGFPLSLEDSFFEKLTSPPPPTPTQPFKV